MKKILYVEDDKSIAKIISSRLKKEGYGVKTVFNALEGIEVINEYQPDLVITGILMPKVSGFDFIAILKQTPETKDIPIVVYSALSSQKDIDRAKELGAIDYMVMSKLPVKDVMKRIDKLFAELEQKS